MNFSERCIEFEQKEIKLIRLCTDAFDKGMSVVPIAAIDVIFGWSNNDERVDERAGG